MKPLIRFCVALVFMSSLSQARSPKDVTIYTLFDFSAEPPSRPWNAVNDGVMGGLSQGAARIREKSMEFSGVLSLENNGGFSSIREYVRADFSQYEGLHFRVLGDGRSYQVRMESDALIWGRRPVSFSFEFETAKGEWIDVYVPFDQLQQSWRGRRLDGYQFNKGDVRMLGILLGDKTPGPFSLLVETVGAYKVQDSSVL